MLNSWYYFFNSNTFYERFGQGMLPHTRAVVTEPSIHYGLFVNVISSLSLDNRV